MVVPCMVLLILLSAHLRATIFFPDTTASNKSVSSPSAVTRDSASQRHVTSVQKTTSYATTLQPMTSPATTLGEQISSFSTKINGNESTLRTAVFGK